VLRATKRETRFRGTSGPINAEVGGGELGFGSADDRDGSPASPSFVHELILMGNKNAQVCPYLDFEDCGFHSPVRSSNVDSHSVCIPRV
jgi:hypothetical protein